MKKNYQSGAQKRQAERRKIAEAFGNSQQLSLWLTRSETFKANEQDVSIRKTKSTPQLVQVSIRETENSDIIKDSSDASKNDFFTIIVNLSFYLKLWQIWEDCLLSPSVLSGYNGSPDTRFSRGTTRLMSWPNGERYSCPLQPLVISLLLSPVSTLLFSQAGGVLSHRSSLTLRYPRFPPKNLCSLVMLAVSSLVYAATDTAFC